MGTALKTLLKKAGFTEPEIEIYLMLLEHGASVASDIASRTGINRSTTYLHVDALVKRGLILETEHRGVKTFAPAELEKLVAYLQRAADHFNALAEQANLLIPSLRKQTKVNPESGIDAAYGAALASLEHIRASAPPTQKHLPAKHATKPKLA